jgi:LmbE family N-acetylglucosaminyl deacetylase
MPDATNSVPILDLGRASRAARRTFEMRARRATSARRLAEALGIDAVRKLRFAGSARTRGKARLAACRGRLGATVVQPCVVTLVPP